MDIENLLKSNVNLEDYLNKYYENPKFIFNYYLQDINRITNNFYLYSAFLNNEDKLSLFKVTISTFNLEISSNNL